MADEPGTQVTDRQGIRIHLAASEIDIPLNLCTASRSPVALETIRTADPPQNGLNPSVLVSRMPVTIVPVISSI